MSWLQLCGRMSTHNEAGGGVTLPCSLGESDVLLLLLLLLLLSHSCMRVTCCSWGQYLAAWRRAADRHSTSLTAWVL
jgi:hypothetical protein